MAGTARSSSNARRPAGYEGRFDAFGWHLISRVGRLRRTLPHPHPSLVDLGMGRGRDILYLARHGFQVLGIDRDRAAVAKGVHRAARLGIPIRTRVADLRDYRWARRYDVVFSSGFLNYLPSRERRDRIDRFRSATYPGGVHAVNAFVARRTFDGIPDLDPEMTPFRPGELRGYYRGWNILATDTEERECSFGGPHRHTVATVVARRPGGPSSLDRA